jgi:UDP-glucose 4-epimerase
LSPSSPSSILLGEPVTIFGDGEQTRDFVFVDDVVDAFVRAATRGGGLICNVGTGAETSVNEVYLTMAEQAGVDAAPVLAPLRPGELLRSSLDIERAAIQLGWRPWTSLADGTRAVLEFVRRAAPAELLRYSRSETRTQINGRGPRRAAG